MSLTAISGTIQSQPLNDNFSYLNQQIEQLVFNVKDGLYGAKGDGITDDTVAINAACTAAAAVNGTVFFPPGTYLHSRIVIPAGVKGYLGSGSGTIFKPTGILNATEALINFANATGVNVGNFTVTTDTAIYPSTVSIIINTCNDVFVHDILIPTIGFVGVYTLNCSYSLFKNIKIDSTSHRGIEHAGSGSTNIITENCNVLHTGDEVGIICSGGVEHVIDKCYASDCFIFGISMTSVNRGKIINCRTYNTVREGINLDTCLSCLVDNNNCYWTGTTSTDFGISTNGPGAAISQNNIISNNIIENAGKSGIALAENSSFSTVIDNKIINCNLANEAQGAGVLIYGTAAVDNLIAHNTIRDSAATIKYGVNEYNGGFGAPNANRIEGNYIYNFVTAKVGLLGALSKSDTWIAYTPTITSGTGALTSATATGKFMIVGDLCNVFIDITLTTTGTGSSNITATLPRAGINTEILNGRENGVSGFELQGTVSTNNLIIRDYGNLYPGANGARMFINGSYQIA